MLSSYVKTSNSFSDAVQLARMGNDTTHRVLHMARAAPAHLSPAPLCPYICSAQLSHISGPLTAPSHEETPPLSDPRHSPLTDSPLRWAVTPMNTQESEQEGRKLMLLGHTLRVSHCGPCRVQ